MKKQNFENYKLDLANNKKFSSITEFEFIKDPKKNKTQLGVGSFGEVKLAIHKKSGTKFAIKIMNLKNMNSFQEIQGIEREVRVHSLLKHPNIIEYHDSFQENEFVFIVLDYASNGNLYSLLYKKRSFSEKEAYKYFSQTCEAIKYLHSINIVHRDLKPENILLDDEFNIKVCDFGWCTEDIENPRNTFCGTYEYMAPEIVFRQPYDYRIDIWALGVLIYELLHGCAPFKGKTFKEIQRKIEKGDVQFSDQISDLSKQLICKVLQANPSRRISIEDIMSHAWMHKMRVIEKDERRLIDQSKSTTNLSKPQITVNNAQNTPKVEENDQPKTKEMQQIQKKPDNRSQSPININQKSSNKNLLNNNETKINEKENISQIPYNSICNAELSDKKKNNTPNKTTAAIPKKENENMSNQKKLFSNQKQTAQSIEFHKTIMTEPQSEFQLYQKDAQSAQKIFQQSEFNQMDKQTEQFPLQQQQLELKKTRNVKSTTPTHLSSQQSAENMFKNLDQKEVNQINSIAKRQQEQMKLANNYLTQQTHQQQNEAQELKMNVNTETAYSKEIDENSIKNSQKTINTSRFINKHGSIHGNSLHQPQSSITSSIQSGQNSNYFMPSKGINISQMLQQNNFFNQTDEIKFQLEAQHNSQSCTKTEGNQYIQNRNNNPNTSITQEEPCFSLFGCLGPSHVSTTQRNRDNSSSNQKLQIKNLFSNQTHSHNQSTNSAYSTFTNQAENRPRINSTNMVSNHSFLKQQSVSPINYQSSVSTSQQYGTANQNQADKNTFSTQRSSNSLTNKVTNYSFLNQQQNNNGSFSNNAKISGSYLQQMQQQQSKQPLGDKTNLPVSAIPTKQINLQDERKNIQKQQSGINSSSGKQDTQQSQLSSASKNNNSYLQNQYFNKERSLTQDCQTLQNQFCQGQNNQNNQSFLSNQIKINQQISSNNSNSISYSNSKLEKSQGMSINDVSRSNRTGQRSRTLIFEEINTEKTKSVIESMEQMLSFVRNALPFVSSSSSCQNEYNNNQINVNLSNNQNPFANFQDIYNQNDISCNANISILQNTSIQKMSSQDSSTTPTNGNQSKQSASSKQIININNLKSQRIEQQSNTNDQQFRQQQQKSNSNNNTNCNFNNNINYNQNRGKQKIFESKHVNNSSSFHSNHTPMQSISNLNNVGVNNYFTQKPSPIQSQQNMPSNTQLSKHQSQNQNDYHPSNNKFAPNQNSLNNNNNQACLYFQ
ncbi:Serine/Threonine kinase domain protein (macronuclear) [Tetrahymena thermophila SB210]|uniref:Aurora kinase n=1 Tax=Tetrahymena thermophila (strain SB210) TaxID=312017 RepID=I7M104_TETTS|nr:Serine/Threonine kinase domain protein [Tetrahymena thermophila SB210]EAR93776.2 Serine/Threonine kinase domain protein [Tetrahymena thermophila SB210]|eukprot:XP_001014021.2 Serine/Threonine kinase domain protein [Tetrahymena thermophila SB210]